MAQKVSHKKDEQISPCLKMFFIILTSFVLGDDDDICEVITSISVATSL